MDLNRSVKDPKPFAWTRSADEILPGIARFAQKTTDDHRRTPVALFQTHILGGGVDNQQGRQYDVATAWAYEVVSDRETWSRFVYCHTWRSTVSPGS